MLRLCALIFSLICLNASAKAIIFSDSLADEGRIYALTDEQLPSPEYYFEGRYSNGPTWPEYAFSDRENYAYAGAESDYSNFLEPELGTLVDNTGLLGQVDEYIAAHPTAEDNAAFYIGIGANDILELTRAEAASSTFLIAGIMENIKLAMHRLETTGAQQFMFIGLPDLAATPIANDMSDAERKLLTAMSEQYNKELVLLSTRYGAQYISMNRLFSMILNHPAKYGFTNVTDACFNEQTFEVCDNPEEYVFWDNVHPTTRVHQMFAATVK